MTVPALFAPRSREPLEGRLRYQVLDPNSEMILEPGRPGLILPEQPHLVEPLEPVRMQVEFYDQVPDL